MLIEQLPPNADSALYRASHPHDWWYDWPVQVAAHQLLALQGANWQRGGGQGTRPTLLTPNYPQPERPVAQVIPLDQIKDRLEAARQRARERRAT